ncbi:hypothetical protein AB0C38_11050 [Amycolatopsis sp. NPDC048633]
MAVEKSLVVDIALPTVTNDGSHLVIINRPPRSSRDRDRPRSSDNDVGT